MHRRRTALLVTLALGWALVLVPHAADGDRPVLDVPYVRTPQRVVEAMLEVARVSRDDIVYDLGSGDGRIVITAAQKYGARGIGYDIDPERIEEARANARAAGVEGRVRFELQNIFTADFREATVVTMYLLPDVNLKIKPRLLDQLRPGTRVVSHAFDLGEWKPDRVLNIKGDDGQYTVYFWVVPPRKPGG
jgi:trans-aconitate methyltransferase